ncbi:MAG TPA: TauD/TfdA family dioxygenase, partial [Pirellulales bacterium]|nr:TauD/TfdA family dioxygenase [Pirellulales bacterium]
MLSTDLKVVPISVGQKTYDGTPFPLVLECQSPDVTLEAACAWVRPRSAELCADAEKAGTVLFRGFPLRTPEDFDQFIQAFGLENFAYEDSLSNAVRVNKTPRVFTANEAPPHVNIYFHHEMAQTPLYPSKLFFFCEKPAEEGGATPLCRSDLLWN